MKPVWLVAAAGIFLPLALCAQPVIKPKLACIGDSITEGSGLSDPASQSYPAKLGRLLAPTHNVRNFGVSGTTLLSKGDMPYVKQSQYKASLAWNPDLVIIMLGSNDAKPQNWRYGTNYISDYLALIASYTSLTSHPSIYLCTPCPGYGAGAYSINPGVIHTNIVPAIHEISLDTGWPLIDVHNIMAGHPEWFPDLIHPNSAGATAMATGICASLVDPSGDDGLLTLHLRAAAPGRVHLSWPVDGLVFVLQECKHMDLTTNVWTVVDKPAVNDGASISVSNLSPGVLRFYRLRRAGW